MHILPEASEDRGFSQVRACRGDSGDGEKSIKRIFRCDISCDIKRRIIDILGQRRRAIGQRRTVIKQRRTVIRQRRTVIKQRRTVIRQRRTVIGQRRMVI